MKEVSGNAKITTKGNVDENIGNSNTVVINGEYKKTVNKSATYEITANETKTIKGEKFLTVSKNNHANLISNSFTIIGGIGSVHANNHLEFISKTGNIDLKTLGLFIADNDGNITPDGYANLGRAGNIRLTSTFGNIGINTIENPSIIDLDKDYTCIAWNPSYLKQLNIIASALPSFVTSSVLLPIEIRTRFNIDI